MGGGGNQKWDGYTEPYKPNEENLPPFYPKTDERQMEGYDIEGIPEKEPKSKKLYKSPETLEREKKDKERKAALKAMTSEQRTEMFAKNKFINKKASEYWKKIGQAPTEQQKKQWEKDYQKYKTGRDLRIWKDLVRLFGEKEVRRLHPELSKSAGELQKKTIQNNKGKREREQNKSKQESLKSQLQKAEVKSKRIWKEKRKIFQVKEDILKKIDDKKYGEFYQKYKGTDVMKTEENYNKQFAKDYPELVKLNKETKIKFEAVDLDLRRNDAKINYLEGKIQEQQQENSRRQLIGGKIKIQGRGLEEIGNSLEKMGYDIKVNYSRSTKSMYLYVNNIKFKISDHTKTSTNPNIGGDFGVGRHDVFIWREKGWQQKLKEEIKKAIKEQDIE